MSRGTHRATRPTRHRTRWKAVCALGVVAVCSTAGTWAAWTDEVAIAGVTVTSGKLDLKAEGQDSVATFTGLNATNLIPTNSVAATIVMSNSGTIGLVYNGVSAGTANALTTALEVKVTLGTVSGTGNTKTCSGTTITGATTLGPALFAANRALAVGASETLCVQLSLPATAPNAAQALSSAITLTFNASP